jgi:hypothetical protein
MIEAMDRKGEMLVVGKLGSDPLAQMGRVQRRAHLLAPQAGFPKGVQKFRTWDEVASWTKKKRET